MSRILVIDDEHVVRMLVVEILETAGHDVTDADSAERALSLLDESDFDLVVSDVIMPGLSGLELLEAIRARRASLPVVLITGAGTYDTLSQALTRGAAGLVTKPFAHSDLQSAVADALERAKRSSDELRERLLAPTLASALANAIEARDEYLHGHCERLASLAVRIAELIELTPTEIETLRLGAILHDVGKIGIPDRVLLKPGPLNDEERHVVETHPEIGDKLLEPLDLLAATRPIVRHHHERWDGTGYPDRLTGDEIPLGARIVAVADSVEVMSSRQLYRSPRTADEIVAELKSCRGAQWDPRIVDVALGLIESGELVLGADGLHLLTPEPEAPATTGLSVLLVEDDDEQAVELTATLESALDAPVIARVACTSGADDLATAAVWSLAIVDHAADGKGIEVVDALRASHPTMPILFLTDDASDAIAIRAFRSGASDYVVKDTGYLDALVARIQQVVALNGTASTSPVFDTPLRVEVKQ